MVEPEKVKVPKLPASAREKITQETFGAILSALTCDCQCEACVILRRAGKSMKEEILK